jgi:hypothetical protein
MPKGPPDKKWGQVPPSPEPEELYKELERRSEHWEDQVLRISLNILVWGPGKGGGALYEKRLQIRDVLRQQGHDARFSEDVRRKSKLGKLSLRHEELLQALAADLIVTLYCSPGSIAEVHDFARLDVLGRKMLIFADEDTREGYGGQGLLRELLEDSKNVEYYTPDDITQCHLLGKVQGKVRKLQLAKLMRDLESST